MSFRCSENPQEWQALYSRLDAFRDSQNRRNAFAFPLALCFIVIFVYAFFHFIPYLNALLEKYSPTRQILAVFLASLLAFLLFASLTTRPAYRVAQSFFQEFYAPPEGVSPAKIINYRFFGRMYLPPPLDLFSQFRYLIARDGDIANKEDWPAWMAFHLGGPLSLILFDGHALYLERGNRFSRVVGPGEKTAFLEWYERVKYMVDYRPKVKVDSFDAWTKDGVKIKITAQLECRIGSPENISESLIYAYSPDDIKKAVERLSIRWINRQEDPSEFTWLDAAWGQVTGVVPGYIGRRTLDDILVAERRSGQILSPDAMEEILSSLNKAANSFGVYVTGFQILKCALPKEVEDCRKEYWMAKRQSAKTISEGQAKAYDIRAREQARIEAQRDLISAMAEALNRGDPNSYGETLLAFFASLLDETLSDPLMRFYIADETLDVLEKIKTFYNDDRGLYVS